MPPLPSRVLPVEPGGLYLVLSQIVHEFSRWHWGLYLSYDHVSGRIFHIIDCYGPWRFEAGDTRRIPISEEVLVLLQVAVVEPDMQHPLLDRITAVPLTTSDGQTAHTCRTWALEVLRQLDDEGWISLATSSTDEVEQEASGVARDNRLLNIRTLQKSAFCNLT